MVRLRGLLSAILAVLGTIPLTSTSCRPRQGEPAALTPGSVRPAPAPDASAGAGPQAVVSPRPAPAPGPARIMPSLASVPVGWTVDRFSPHSFSNMGTFQGRDDVLGLEITSAEGFSSRDADHQSAFYSFQGRWHDLSSQSGDTPGVGSVLSADLWIPERWANPAGGSVATDLWAQVPMGDDNAWPIIGFTNENGPPRYRVWPTSGGWLDFDLPVVYEAWSTFAFELTADELIYSINGTQVHRDPAAGLTGFRTVIIQATNFHGDPSFGGSIPVDYTAYWSNTPAAR